jgi:hypothetical protein
MNPIDIIYTPLDIPEAPKIDLTKLMSWIQEHRSSQKIHNRKESDLSEVMNPKEYPWNIIYPRYQYQWYKNFDILFPQIAEYISTNFTVSIDEIQDVVLLPLKNNFVGTGFFHADPDECGLRFYIENNESGDFLLIHQAIKPFIARSQILESSPEDFSPTICRPKLLRPNQAFFINNVRALHAVHSTKADCVRIAVNITVPKSIHTMNTKLRDLIVNSAEKFSDYSIYWDPSQ